MSAEHITDVLAERVLGLKVCPDRYIKNGRAWIPKHRFQPLVRLQDAFLLLDSTASNYTLKCVGGVFTAQVQIVRGVGTASGKAKAEVITLAVVRALHLEF